MKLTIEGTVYEIAAFVMDVQERQSARCLSCDDVFRCIEEYVIEAEKQAFDHSESDPKSSTQEMVQKTSERIIDSVKNWSIRDKAEEDSECACD